MLQPPVPQLLRMAWDKHRRLALGDLLLTWELALGWPARQPGCSCSACSERAMTSPVKLTALPPASLLLKCVSQ